ncbi:hypothetical protein [Kribbella sp. NPDC048928]|uniref:hypothetical protein n=1 Tax=Kribbella sp. NPDC048928 TaxID=3364111 RepID=UPI00371934DB
MSVVDELLNTAVGLSRSLCEQLLGELIAVPDPLITSGQAARVLGLNRGQVPRLERQGWLARQENTQLKRIYRLSDVLELVQPISVTAAAVLIGCKPDRVAVPTARRLRRLDAVLQRGRRRRPPDVSWPFPVDESVELAPTLVDHDPDRWIGLSEAAAVLGVTYSAVHHMAAEGRLPAEHDEYGWRVQYDKVILARNAIAARAARNAPPHPND